MATKKTKGLGRGLDALLIPEPAAADPAGVPMLLPLEEISPGQYQPRTRMDEGALYELAVGRILIQVDAVLTLQAGDINAGLELLQNITHRYHLPIHPKEAQKQRQIGRAHV